MAAFQQHPSRPGQDSNLPPQTGPATEAGAVDPEDVPMHKISANDIQLVQNLIERCLQSYYNEPEIIESLYMNDNIEPGFTSLEQNQQFFKAYQMRLTIKEQVTSFNYLVVQQAALMQSAGVYIPLSSPPVKLPMTPTQLSPGMVSPSQSSPFHFPGMGYANALGGVHQGLQTPSGSNPGQNAQGSL